MACVNDAIVFSADESKWSIFHLHMGYRTTPLTTVADCNEIFLCNNPLPKFRKPQPSLRSRLHVFFLCVCAKPLFPCIIQILAVAVSSTNTAQSSRKSDCVKNWRL